MATWPLREEPPPGWQRSEYGVLITRVATGEPADDAVEVIGYTVTIDCGLPNV